MRGADDYLRGVRLSRHLVFRLGKDNRYYGDIDLGADVGLSGIGSVTAPWWSIEGCDSGEGDLVGGRVNLPSKLRRTSSLVSNGVTGTRMNQRSRADRIDGVVPNW